MEPKPTAPSGHEASINRRQTLHALAKSAGILFTVQIAHLLRYLPASIAQAAAARPKGDDMNHDVYQQTPDP